MYNMKLMMMIIINFDGIVNNDQSTENYMELNRILKAAMIGLRTQFQEAEKEKRKSTLRNIIIEDSNVWKCHQLFINAFSV